MYAAYAKSCGDYYVKRRITSPEKVIIAGVNVRNNNVITAFCLTLTPALTLLLLHFSWILCSDRLISLGT